MNLESEIDKQLWNSIKSHYESKNFSSAILDSIYFLNTLIRDKTGIESDGVALVGEALGGKHPKLKINHLQTQSEWNIQQGIEQILRGIIQAIRNPRSHEKYNDSCADADSIICFINYIVKIIEQSKTPFTEREFIQRVFDSNFVMNSRYAELLIQEIPIRKRFDILIEVYQNKNNGTEDKLRYFFEAILTVLQQEEVDQFYEIVSHELKYTIEEKTLRMIFVALPPNLYNKIEEVARLRMEDIFIKSISAGRYFKEDDSFEGGELGTWAGNELKRFAMKGQLINILTEKLESSIADQEYVFRWFFHDLFYLVEKPSDRLISLIINGLKDGDRRFYDAIKFVMEDVYAPDWSIPLTKAYNKFKEFKPENNTVISDINLEDLPF